MTWETDRQTDRQTDTGRGAGVDGPHRAREGESSPFSVWTPFPLAPPARFLASLHGPMHDLRSTPEPLWDLQKLRGAAEEDFTIFNNAHPS